MNSWYRRLRGQCINTLLRAGLAFTGLALLPSSASATTNHHDATDSLAGVHVAVASPPCEPVSVYGPPMCSSDEECVKENGEGWYCNKDHGYSDGCGGNISWPVCEPGPKKPLVAEEPVVNDDKKEDKKDEKGIDTPPGPDGPKVEEDKQIKTYYGPAPVYGPPPTRK